MIFIRLPLVICFIAVSGATTLIEDALLGGSNTNLLSGIASLKALSSPVATYGSSNEYSKCNDNCKPAYTAKQRSVSLVPVSLAYLVQPPPLITPKALPTIDLKAKLEELVKFKTNLHSMLMTKLRALKPPAPVASPVLLLAPVVPKAYKPPTTPYSACKPCYQPTTTTAAPIQAVCCLPYTTPYVTPSTCKPCYTPTTTTTTTTTTAAPIEAICCYSPTKKPYTKSYGNYPEVKYLTTAKPTYPTSGNVYDYAPLYKRSVLQLNETENSTVTIKSKRAVGVSDLDEALDLVRQLELEHCVAKPICELSCDEAQFGPAGRVVSQAFVRFGLVTQQSLKTAMYREAAVKGHTLRLPFPRCNDCGTFYPNCPASSKDLISIASKVVPSLN